MRPALIAFRYLRLRSEDGKLLLWRDALPVFIILAGYVLLRHLVIDLNFFGASGVADKIGSLTSTLTGFYVAALVAASTFASGHVRLDTVISVGKIFDYLPVEGDRERDYLTRREYICSIFSYLSALALIIALASIFSVAIASAANLPSERLSAVVYWFRQIPAFVYIMLVAHMMVTTIHGLYYLSYRIYLGDGEALRQDE